MSEICDATSLSKSLFPQIENCFLGEDQNAFERAMSCMVVSFDFIRAIVPTECFEASITLYCYPKEYVIGKGACGSHLGMATNYSTVCIELDPD